MVPLNFRINKDFLMREKAVVDTTSSDTVTITVTYTDADRRRDYLLAWGKFLAGGILGVFFFLLFCIALGDYVRTFIHFPK